MPPPDPPRVKEGRTRQGKPSCRGDRLGLGDGARQAGGWHRQSGRNHRVLELEPILGQLDGGGLRADQPHAVLLQHAGVRQIHRQVQAGLPADGGQQGIGPLGRDDLLAERHGQRLDVGRVGHLGVGHDGGRIGVHQDDAIALAAQRFAGLHAGVVELAPLADDDRAGAEDQDGADVSAFGHCDRTETTKTPKHTMQFLVSFVSL